MNIEKVISTIYAFNYFSNIEASVADPSNEKFPKRGAVSRRLQRPSGASSDGGGTTPAWDTTSPAPRGARWGPVAGTASSAHRILVYCP